ncbi:MAG: hypothetical protein VST68_03260 [Nitrospirota bacterium]|nr:hypothetical protein [Nitrospirota bacterium]
MSVYKEMGFGTPQGCPLGKGQRARLVVWVLYRCPMVKEKVGVEVSRDPLVQWVQ